MALMTCKDLALGYQKTVLVQGLNLDVNRGDYWCVIGDNGVGKSTLLRTLLGLQPPLAGRITLGEGLRRRIWATCPSRRRCSGTFPPRWRRSSAPAARPAWAPGPSSPGRRDVG